MEADCSALHLLKSMTYFAGNYVTLAKFLLCLESAVCEKYYSFAILTCGISWKFEERYFLSEMNGNQLVNEFQVPAALSDETSGLHEHLFALAQAEAGPEHSACQGSDAGGEGDGADVNAVVHGVSSEKR
jgi:hypothetical protein